jgi:putative transposase
MMTLTEMKYGRRGSRMYLGEVYFWTCTIKDWKRLLDNDFYKQVIIESWRELIKRQKITIYGFVIMPNHLHMIWEMIDQNGKENAYASFNKFTSHQFLNDLKATSPHSLTLYAEETSERRHRFWQRDALAKTINSTKQAASVLDYIHTNPLQEHWNLANKPEDYKWSSARFYETGSDEFSIITDYRERF